MAATSSNEHVGDDKHELPYAAVPHLSDYVKGEHHWAPNPIPNYYSSRFRNEDEYVLIDIVRNCNRSAPAAAQAGVQGFLRGGPRARVFFCAPQVKAAIVTCGGLCPGLNSVIRELYNALTRLYGVDSVWGVLYGYRGFYSKNAPPRKLSARDVENLHELGGTILGSSRGGFELAKIVNGIVEHGFTQLFIIGGDGTHRGAHAIYEELRCRGLKIAIIGIPKTIDNDIALIDHSFGFHTAVCASEKALKSATVAANCAVNGICIVQLMGRQSGFVSAHATLASREVDICLVPEVRFDRTLLARYVAACLKAKSRCVICQAEAAGIEYCSLIEDATDSSGNRRLPDVSRWLHDFLTEYLSQGENDLCQVNCRIINPSYMICSVPPNIADRQYCSFLAIHAVHAAMCGYTGITIGLVNNHYVWLPLLTLGNAPAQLDPKGSVWMDVLELTGQPSFDVPQELVI